MKTFDKLGIWLMNQSNFVFFGTAFIMALIFIGAMVGAWALANWAF